MKTFKAKLKALLMTIGCFAVCLTAGAAIAAQSVATQVTASAETYTTSRLGATGDSSASVVYAYPLEGYELVKEGDWANAYQFQTGSGAGVTLNDVVLEGWEIKQPGDFYIALGTTVQAGDELRLDGTFYSEGAGKTYVFNDCALKYDGAAWTTGVSYSNSTYTFNKLSGANGCTAEVVYAYPTDGDALPSGDWDNRFTLQSGEGLKLNDTVLEGWEIKQPGDFYIVLGTTAQAGDILTINGTFVNETIAKKFVFNDCVLKYDGAAWTTGVSYSNSTYTFNKLSGANGCTAGVVYAYPTDGDALPSGDWDNRFTLQSGEGLKLNDTVLEGWEIKQPGDFYIVLGTTAQAGDILTINGTFVNETIAKKFVFNDCKLVYNGTTWITGLAYTTYELGEVVGLVDATNANGYLTFAQGVELPISSWDYAFKLFSGNGITIDGVPVDMTNNVKSVGGKLFVTFTTPASVNSTLVIGGTFYNEALAVKYVVEESKFTWNGSAWENYIDYTTHEIGRLTFKGNDNATNIYLKRADGNEIEIATTENDLHWTTAFTFQADSGVGVALNGTQIAMNDVKFPGSMYIGLGKTAKAGDVLVVGGTFYSSKLAYKYVIEESKFVFNGSTWSDFVSIYTISNLQPTASSTAKAPVYLKINGDTNLPVVNDTYTFDHTDGAGFVKDGSQLKMTTIKSTSDGFNFKFAKSNSIVAGEVFTLSGTFYCEELDVTYIIEECKLTWTGSAWEIYEHYDSYELGLAVSISDGYIEFEEKSLPISSWDYAFDYVSGNGITVDGVMINMTNTVKSVGDKLYVDLGATAVNKDSKLKIGGVLRSKATKVEYIIEDTEFTWNGNAWALPVEYTTHNIGELLLHVNSSVGGASGLNNQLYLQRADGAALPVESWEYVFFYESGTGFTVNGVQKTPIAIKSTGDGFFWNFDSVSAGTVITIGGVFVCDAQATKYVIEDSAFVWTGSGWTLLGEDYSNLIEGVTYDTITIVDLGFDVEETVNGLVDGAGFSYIASEDNTTGSVKFRFGINAENMSAGAYDIRMRGAAWDGIRFILGNGVIQSFYSLTNKSVPLSSNTYYEIELGLIDTADGNSIWLYAKVDDVLYISDLVAKTDKNAYDEQKAFGEYTSNHVSFYGDLGTVTLYDPDSAKVIYTTEYGTNVEYTQRNAEYTLAQSKTYETFIGWKAADGTIYTAGETIVLEESMSLTAITIDFYLEDGAAIRLNTSADSSGIRFTTNISTADLTLLETYGITVNSYGTLIIPFDYLGRNQGPNLSDFEAGSTILKIPSTYSETVGDYVVYRGAMQKLNEGNYARLIPGRGYMELTVNGEDIIVYTPFDMEDNVRSIRNIALKFQADTEEYNKVSDTKKAVVAESAANGEINLMNYAAYGNNNFLHLIAWYHPELDPSNAYNNETNIALAQKIKDAGMTAVYLDGEYHLDLNKQENVEKTRQIIKFFWSQGLYTIAFGSNNANNLAIDYSTNVYPDFSDCEGFMGYLVWDEPQSGSFDTLADFANNFESVYAGSNAMFMANLLPSYATAFNSGSASWFESSLETLNKNTYKTYVQNYCETVLSQIDGEKWLSMDSYPINSDNSLMPNFLFDLAVLSYYSKQYDAHAHAVLQSSGWTEEGTTIKNRMPTEAEMRMQAYAAMAFGVDSISWWSYSDKRNDNQENPTDSNDYYSRFANVNNELSAISTIYSAFDWKGVILGAGKDNGSWNPDEDYEAFNVVKGQIGDYELSVGDTKLLSKVSTNKTDWNYLMGVMEDMNGNEGYVICNYNSHEEDRTQTLTLAFDENVTEVIIYRGGVAQTVAVNNKTLTINLATGEGVIVLPSKIG